jgi:hypothetical protein
MPSRLLGPDRARLTPISLPRPASATVVVAAPPVVEPDAKAVRPAVPAPVAQLASIVHRAASTPKTPVAHHVVAHPGAAHVTVLNRARRHPLPADQPRIPTPAPVPAPAPAPPPAAPAAAPAPAPASPTPPRVYAYTSTSPVTPPSSGANCPQESGHGNGGNGNGGNSNGGNGNGGNGNGAADGKDHGQGAGGDQQGSAHDHGNK